MFRGLQRQSMGGQRARESALRAVLGAPRKNIERIAERRERLVARQLQLRREPCH